MDFARNLRLAVKTGKVYLGIREAIKHQKKAKLIIQSLNAPHRFKRVYRFEGSSQELGRLCGKPFPVSTVTILEPGKSEILTMK